MKQGLELIASENFFALKSVLECFNCFTNKYSEGQVYNRHYGDVK